MSKLDAQRAMREAKYARDSASGPTRREAAAAASGGAASGGAAPAIRPVTPGRPARKATAAVAPEGDLCGHRSMNGRACTRELGHSEKSHRYS